MGAFTARGVVGSLLPRAIIARPFFARTLGGLLRTRLLRALWLRPSGLASGPFTCPVVTFLAPTALLLVTLGGWFAFRRAVPFWARSLAIRCGGRSVVAGCTLWRWNGRRHHVFVVILVPKVHVRAWRAGRLRPLNRRRREVRLPRLLGPATAIVTLAGTGLIRATLFSATLATAVLIPRFLIAWWFPATATCWRTLAGRIGLLGATGPLGRTTLGRIFSHPA